jgi:hypothetical protein
MDQLLGDLASLPGAYYGVPESDKRIRDRIVVHSFRLFLGVRTTQRHHHLQFRLPLRVFVQYHHDTEDKIFEKYFLPHHKFSAADMD